MKCDRCERPLPPCHARVRGTFRYTEAGAGGPRRRRHGVAEIDGRYCLPCRTECLPALKAFRLHVVEVVPPS